MKKILAIAALCTATTFAYAQEKVTAKTETMEKSEVKEDNVLELRYIKVPDEHKDNSIMVDGKRYELWHNKGRAEHIYKTQYLPKNLGKTVIYIRSNEEKEPETIRYDD